jgi:hypothetical protein
MFVKFSLTENIRLSGNLNIETTTRNFSPAHTPLVDKFQPYLLGSCSNFLNTQIVKAKNERFAVKEEHFVPLLASHDAASKLFC